MFIHNEILLSVIIPAYNAEKTLRQCVKSILTEKTEFFEIIIVDDGSDDLTYETISDLISKQVKYYKRQRGGVSRARNYGLKMAKGKYISFVDSDDYVCRGYIEKIIKLLSSSDYDLILFNHYVERQGITQLNLIKENCHTIENVFEFACKQQINAPWDKIFKRDIILENDIRFNENMKTSEDGAFLIDYLNWCKSFEKLEDALYVYVINELGTVRNPKTEYIYDQAMMQCKIKRFLSNHRNLTDILKDTVEDIEMERMFCLVSNLIRKGADKRKISYFLSDSKYIFNIDLKKLNKKNKIKYVILKEKIYILTQLVKEQ